MHLTTIFLFFAASNAQILLPKPSGRYVVNQTIVQLTDDSRIDPYQPGNIPRSVLISTFYPSSELKASSQFCPSPYLPPLTAAFLDQKYSVVGLPNGTFEQFQLQLPCPTTSSNKNCLSSKQNFPVILFSPGSGVSRLLYSVLAQQLASAGHIVITIDHPGDADIVEFPDGKVVYDALPNATLDDFAKAVDVRAQDATFVLNSISKAPVAKQLIPGAKAGFNVQKVGMYGHSLGGATAFSTAYLDKRIVGAVDLDGLLFGPVIENGLSKKQALLFFGRSDHNSTSDETVAGAIKNSKGWKKSLVLDGAQHLTYSDLPVLASLLGIQEALADYVGTVPGARVLQILPRYLTEFFSLAIKGKAEELLKGPSAEFPEVVFVS